MARYDKEFDPILLENHTASLYGTGLPEEGLNVRCVAVGALPEYWNDFGALVAGVWSAAATDTNLEMNTMELSQFRIRIVSAARMRMAHPGSVRQWRTRNIQFYLPQFPAGPGDDFLQSFYWKSSEFFVFEDNTPQFEFMSPVALANCFVLFSGWRFRLQKIDAPGRIAIWTSEWPTTSSMPRHPR